MPKSATHSSSGYREIPSVDEILRAEVGALLVESFGPSNAAEVVRDAIEAVRADGIDAETTRESITAMIEERLVAELGRSQMKRQQKVINATGVVIHTNLGRAPLSVSAIEAAVASAGYCNLEYDLETGERGARGESATKLIAAITGAEDALIVNNCAAAAMLMLSVFGRGGEVIISRGELVEIGGDFRVPDVLERSGATLREVGTTNRTKLADYERAINENTKLILRVHPSNYRITGFTGKPQLSELADLARGRGIPFFEDAGSGALLDLSAYGLDEPVIADSISAGVDLVCFSGDKLMGGVQAGMIVGRREYVERLRRDPLYRVLRANKVTYAITEATLQEYVAGNEYEAIPVLKNLSATEEEVGTRSEDFISKAQPNLSSNISLSLFAGSSAIGGGSAPGVELKTRLIAIDCVGLSPDDIAKRFRSFATPVVGRIFDDRFFIDLRTVESNDEHIVAAAISSLTI